MKEYYPSLCYRCEWRARYNEIGKQPRCECGDTHSSKYICYMYKPVAPMVVKPAYPDDPDDPRLPFSAPMAARRVEAVRIAEGAYTLKETDGGLVAYWQPGEAEDGVAE